MSLRFISTSGKSEPVSFIEAMRKGLAPDGGLYMPSRIPSLSMEVLNSLPDLSFVEIAYQIAKKWLSDELNDKQIATIAEEAFDFEPVVKEIGRNQFVLKLFHGPTLAFKDYGARFMARLFSEVADREKRRVTILVATSGDTGSAVAHGFYKVPGVKVFLLYPRGKVSRLQEMQMATLGENVTALEVEGVFDDCQELVKKAFRDPQLNSKMQLSSANSINIARLLPQSFYYAFAAGEMMKKKLKEPVFCVPSGNFGNLTGGLLAEKMGVPVKRFLAATNQNDVIPKYLSGAEFTPVPSVQTISNAMDVGNPSNFARIRYLFDGDDQAIRDRIRGYSFSDGDTIEMIRDLYSREHYLACPHTAVGLSAASHYQKAEGSDHPVVTLATAHPVKFRDVIEPVTGETIPVPSRLASWLQKEKKSIPITGGYRQLLEVLEGEL